MKYCMLALSLFLVTAIGCTISIPLPNEEQIKQDIVGQTLNKEFIVIFVKEIAIQRRFTDKKAGTDEIYALATLDDSTTTIKGILVLDYKKYDQGWKLESVGAKQFTVINKECRPDVPCTWNQAMDYCKREGSRLLTSAEIINIYDSVCNKTGPKSEYCDRRHWSSEPYTANSWLTYFHYRSGVSSDKSETSYVRCVRDGP